MFFCIGENRSKSYSIGEGETIENAVSNWSTSRCIKGYNPVIIQGQYLFIELECPPPIIKIL